jgi:hypothetical protein
MAHVQTDSNLSRSAPHQRLTTTSQGDESWAEAGIGKTVDQRRGRERRATPLDSWLESLPKSDSSGWRILAESNGREAAPWIHVMRQAARLSVVPVFGCRPRSDLQNHILELNCDWN